jgi:hypothetical protein
MEGLVMQYCKYNMDEELKEASEGKRTKEEVGLLLYLALKDRPVIQKCVANAFSITEG